MPYATIALLAGQAIRAADLGRRHELGAIKGLADMVVTGNGLDAKKGAGIGTAVTGLQLPLGIEEGRALQKQHGKSGHGDIRALRPVSRIRCLGAEVVHHRREISALPGTRPGSWQGKTPSRSKKNVKSDTWNQEKSELELLAAPGNRDGAAA